MTLPLASWNFSVNDTSPLLTYLPTSEADMLVEGWQPYYSKSDWDGVGAGQEGIGNSSHATGLMNANVTIQFHGTGVYVYGETSFGLPYDVMLDNNTESDLTADPKRDDDLLYSSTGLTPSLHSLTLINRGPTDINHRLFLEKIVSSTDLDEHEGPPVEVVYEHNDTSVLSYSGSWSDITVPVDSHATSMEGSSVSLSFTQAIGVAIYGITNTSNSHYMVTLSGQPMGIYDSLSHFEVPNALLFFWSGLNPGQTQTINVTNLENNTLAITSFRVYQATSSSMGMPPTPTSSLTSASTFSPTSLKQSSARINAGLIAGPIIGGIIVLMALGLIFLLRSRRRRLYNKFRAIPPSPFVVDGPINPRPLKDEAVTTPGRAMLELHGSSHAHDNPIGQKHPFTQDEGHVDRLLQRIGDLFGRHDEYANETSQPPPYSISGE